MYWIFFSWFRNIALHWLKVNLGKGDNKLLSIILTDWLCLEMEKIVLIIQKGVKVSGHSIFFVGFLPSEFVPFLIKNPQNLSKICIKGTNCEILDLNSRRLGTCYITKKSYTDGRNPIKKIQFWVTSHFNQWLWGMGPRTYNKELS